MPVQQTRQDTRDEVTSYEFDTMVPPSLSDPLPSTPEMAMMTSRLQIASPSSSESDSSTPEPESNSQRRVNPPRPPNCFILFRTDFYRSYRLAVANGERPAAAQKDISRLASARWKELGKAAMEGWIARGEVEKREHAAKYPDYKYEPDQSRKRTKKGKGGKGKAEKKKKLGEKIASKGKTGCAGAGRSRSGSVSSEALGSSFGSSDLGMSSTSTSRESSEDPSSLGPQTFHVPTSSQSSSTPSPVPPAFPWIYDCPYHGEVPRAYAQPNGTAVPTELPLYYHQLQGNPHGFYCPYPVVAYYPYAPPQVQQATPTRDQRPTPSHSQQPTSSPTLSSLSPDATYKHIYNQFMVENHIDT